MLSVLLAVAGQAFASESIADAAERRDRPAVAALLRKRVDVNARQADGATALHWAAHWDDADSVRDLLAAGADPNIPNDYGVTPLFLAVENGSDRVTGLLLQARANASAELPSGQTVLMTAARSGNVPVVNALLASGAAVNAVQHSKGQTALMWAIAARHQDVARALLAKGADPHSRTSSGFTPLLFAAREGDIGLATVLLDRGADINEASKDGFTPLLTATVRGHVALALRLLERGARADGDFVTAGVTPLHWASATFENTPITYIGIQAPGEWAAIGGIPDRPAKLALITALIDRGADVNARTMKRLLVQAPPGGGSFASTPGLGATPFFIAAASADAEVMRLLAGRGADPSIRSAAEETALMIAASADIEISLTLTEPRRIDAMKVALELGNAIEAEDSKGHRAMHLAARGGFHEIIAFLLARGAELNPLTKARTETRTAGQAQQFLKPQTPLGLVEGTIYINFYERPETAALLRGLGARSIGRYDVTAEAPAGSPSGQ